MNDATMEHSPAKNGVHHGRLREALHHAGEIAAAVTSPVKLFGYVKRTFRERPILAALAVSGFVAMFVLGRRRRR